ncbi:MAG TPA: ZIP family metal transporter [Brumimicrobium sp.]|nr:ZIP family metal transporter [Brumimicrobium sp.]
MTLFIYAISLISSVLVGAGIVIFLHRLNQGRVVKILLSVSGGFLLALSFIHFIPEMYAHSTQAIGYYILLGFLLQLFLEYFSRGIEHGHIHADAGMKKGTIPWSLFIALSFHSVFEALPISAMLSGELTGEIAESVGHVHNHALSAEGFLLGIILHNIPLSIALMTLLLASGFNKMKAWILIGIFSIMSPLGMYLGYFGNKGNILNTEVILAVVVGMFLHISTTIIFETSDNHKFNLMKLISLLVGVGLAIFIM